MTTSAACCVLFAVISVNIYAISGDVTDGCHLIDHCETSLSGHICRAFLHRRMATEAAIPERKMSAFVIGYTGAVGRVLVRQLVDSRIYSRIVLIGRRQVEYSDEPLKQLEQKVVDFDKLDEYAKEFTDIDVGFCCLGTTRKKSGAAGFYRVDHDYITHSAKLAHQGGVGEFHLISSASSNANSSLLYFKVKGQVEEEIKSLGFKRLFIYRPSLLLEREGSELVERVLQFAFRPIAWLAPTLISVPVVTLTTAVLANAAAADDDAKTVTLENAAIHRVGAKK